MTHHVSHSPQEAEQKRIKAERLAAVQRAAAAARGPSALKNAPLDAKNVQAPHVPESEVVGNAKKEALAVEEPNEQVQEAKVHA